MKKLNLPDYSFRVKEVDGKKYIFDNIRKKFLILTPEEWVRQHFVSYLVYELGYPSSLIAIEMGISFNNLKRRCDAVIYDRKGVPVMIIECKAPDINISQDTFDQIARYNMKLKVPWLIVTNGEHHYICRVDFVNKKYDFHREIPRFENLVTRNI